MKENNLGEFVRAKRTELGMSLREFAALCGLSHTHVDSIERGYDARSGRKVNPTSETIRKLAAALGVSESELIGAAAPAPAAADDAALKFALFGDGDVSDEKLEEVKKFARFINGGGGDSV